MEGNLTIERKFEAKDVGPEYILKLKRARDDVSSFLEGRKKEHSKMAKRRADTEKAIKDGREAPYMLSEIENEMTPLAEEITRAQREYDRTVTTIEQVEMQQDISKVQQVRTQRLKDIEDIVTLLTLALFSLCIVFMIFVDTGWSYSIFSYSFLSKLLFSVALLVLLIRVYLRSKELKT